jgi:hypothetical protein
MTKYYHLIISITYSTALQCNYCYSIPYVLSEDTLLEGTTILGIAVVSERLLDGLSQSRHIEKHLQSHIHIAALSIVM